MILVTGGTGFVGGHLVARLVAAGEEVRVLARTSIYLPGVELVAGDVKDLSAVVGAARGCAAVIHLVGIIREGKGARFKEVHVGGTRTVIRACQEAGVHRLLHMSALGARPDARSRYHRTKWQAEELVRASGLAATIFRPSVMFGSGNSFLPKLRDLLHRGPIIPIIGDGMSLLQPIWVEDVVSCFLAALRQSDTVAHAYELGGPDTFGFEELVDLLAEAEQITKPKLHLPAPLMRPLVATMSRLLPSFPITSDQLTMLLEDNICDITEMREAFHVDPARLQDHLAD
jgi:uncharacterized protein YbjT (DUF2867 family)